MDMSISAPSDFNQINPATTKGDLIVREATHAGRLPVGANGSVLTADSSTDSGLAWETPATVLADAGVTATAAEINQAADISARFATLTVATTLSGADSGKTLYLDADTEFAVTLPAASLGGGMEFDIVIADAPSGADYTVVTAGGENALFGHITSADLDATVDGAVASGADTINFEDGVAIEGDWVNIRGDGTSWFVRGSESAVGGITFSTT